MNELSFYLRFQELIVCVRNVKTVLSEFIATGIPACRPKDLMPLTGLLESVEKLVAQHEDEEFSQAVKAWLALIRRQIVANEQVVQSLARLKGYSLSTDAERMRFCHALEQDRVQSKGEWVSRPELADHERTMAEALVEELLVERRVESRLCQLTVQSMEHLPLTDQVAAVTEVAVLLSRELSRAQSFRMPDILRTEFRPALYQTLAKTQVLTKAFWRSNYREGLATVERWLAALDRDDERLAQWLAERYEIDLTQGNGRTVLYERNIQELWSRAAGGLRSLVEMWREPEFRELAANGQRIADRLHDARRAMYDVRARQEDREFSVQEQVQARKHMEASRLVATRPVYLTMEVVTFADLWQRGEVIVDLVERIWHAILPYPVRLRTTHWPKEQSGPKPARHSIITPGSSKWLALRDLILQGRLGGLSLEDWEVSLRKRETIIPRVALSVHFGSHVIGRQMRGHLRSDEDSFEPREAKVLDLEVDTAYWSGRVNDEVQEQTVRMAEDLFRRLDAACGYVDLTRRGDSYLTPYERRVGMVNPDGAGLWHSLRGAFWGNFLSRHHVDLVGGQQAVRDDAPCWQVRGIPAREPASVHTGLFLQLTEHLDTAGADEYRKLESYLAPILPSGPTEIRRYAFAPALLVRLGSVADFKRLLGPASQTATRLPCGALLVELVMPAAAGALSAVLEQAHSVGNVYREIPPIHKLDDLDLVRVWTLDEHITKRPKNTPPIYPLVVVQPYILTDEIEFEVVFGEPATDAAIQKLGELVSEWCQLTYEVPVVGSVIAALLAQASTSGKYIWQANLAPVGEAAFVQLIMMLDEFSRTVCRLAEVHVCPAR